MCRLLLFRCDFSSAGADDRIWSCAKKGVALARVLLLDLDLLVAVGFVGVGAHEGRADGVLVADLSGLAGAVGHFLRIEHLIGLDAI